MVLDLQVNTFREAVTVKHIPPGIPNFMTVPTTVTKNKVWQTDKTKT